jgi:histidinol-phosphate/aromatic aminotransferase/cobyric acid decarboxylase-like protein
MVEQIDEGGNDLVALLRAQAVAPHFVWSNVAKLLEKAADYIEEVDDAERVVNQAEIVGKAIDKLGNLRSNFELFTMIIKLCKAAEDLLPYARATIGAPEEDNVILVAQRAIKEGYTVAMMHPPTSSYQSDYVS